MGGFEPPASRMQDAMLSQLSYIPYFASGNAGTWIRTKDLSFIRAAL